MRRGACSPSCRTTRKRFRVGELEPAPAEGLEIRCTQCWQFRPEEEFVGARKPRVDWCRPCRVLYRGGGSRQTRRRGLSSTELRVGFVLRSFNRKLGRIPSSITSGETCPDACGLKDAGCFAEFGIIGMHWREVSKTGLTWAAFLERVRALPERTFWRHNTAGDLPGIGDTLDVERFLELVEAQQGRRGFTMTRKPLDRPNELSAVILANRRGFTVNMTAHGLEDLDRVHARTKGHVPLVVVLPEHTEPWLESPGGLRVTVCPAELSESVTCASCQLCSRTQRRVAVGFRAHGQWKARVSDLVQLKRKGNEKHAG